MSSLSPSNRPPPSQIYTLSLHDALPILSSSRAGAGPGRRGRQRARPPAARVRDRFHRLALVRPQLDAPVAALADLRSEEHTSELQSRGHLVCRLLLEKKKRHNVLALVQM